MVGDSRGVALGFALGLCVWLHAGASAALSIHPLFFEGASGFGFGAAAVEGMPTAASADQNAQWLLAGARSLVPGPGLIVENHLSAVHENPQGQGRTPSEADPFIVDSTWTVANQTGAELAGAYLVFTKIDVDSRYRGLQAGLDGDLLQIVEYSFDGTEYFFGAMRLPSLGVGQSVDLTVRYVVAGSLDYDAESNAFVLPRLGIAGLVVPEPMPVAGIALGLIGFASARARRGRG
ncbi:MAG: PEP-CTERM sorting domain-containing protein [Methylococcaceae bacterium]|nr:PEP-CTERM sorting domain-containing protein [Methylococcaceae bacterium]